MVRHHFGSEVLFDAADRAGLLMVQAVELPTSDETVAGDKAIASQKLLQLFREQIDRLSHHPSLAGWFVPSTDPQQQALANHIHGLDPTRRVFTAMPFLS